MQFKNLVFESSI